MVSRFTTSGGSRVGRRIRRPWRWLPFPIRLRVAQVRGWASRRRAVRRTAVLASVALVAGTTLSAAAELRATRAGWSESIEVYVVTHDVPIGEVFDDPMVERVERPTVLVPDDALRASPLEELAVRELRSGEIITRRDLSSTRSMPELAIDQRAVSLPRHPAIPELQVGDVVDIHVLGDHGVGSEPERVATVIRVSDDAYTVSLDRRSVRAVVGAAAAGRVVVAVR